MEKDTKTTWVSCFQKLITVYKLLISPFLGNRCRFAPTCSQYTHQAIEQYGIMKGMFLSLKRVIRCHPWGRTGYDPVPEVNNHSINKQTTVKEVNN